MRAVVQRVSSGQVSVEGRIVGRIEKGLVVLLGVSVDDDEKDARYLAEKIANLRIFDDEQGKMNLSVRDVGGALLIVSQFTLYGDCRKGRRPGFDQAAPPAKARELYDFFVKAAEDTGLHVETGVFQAHMMVELVNDGPVTMLLDSTKLF